MNQEQSRTLHGCVDWNLAKIFQLQENKVAPYTGAWIEIKIWRETSKQVLVAPYTGAWIEIQVNTAITGKGYRRTLHGCVDWNLKLTQKSVEVSRRTLHGCVDWNKRNRRTWWIWNGRTLHGCVDWNSVGLEMVLALPRRTLHGCVDWNT